MNYSTNYNFNLPSRDEADIADINKISENFVAMDELLDNIEALNRTQSANIVNVNSKATQNATNINANGVKIENNKTDINLLLLGNGVDLTDTIPTSSVTVDGVKYNWSVDAKKITVNCSNTAATSYDFYTFDLTNEMLKNKTLSLIAKSNNANVVCRYTLTNHQGNTASGVLDGSAYSVKTATYRSVMLTITTAEGYKGVATIELSLKYKTTHSDLLSNINDVAERVTAIEEGGGAVGADGKSAYEIWLEQGNEGTEADFLASLVGEKGESITITNTEPIISPSGANKTTITFSDGTSVTISDGERGAKGADGDDGKSIEITNIELSEEDGGENKITFSDGELSSVMVIRNGNKGSTPVKGEDYFTAEDKAELISSTELEDRIKAVILARDEEKYPVGSLYLTTAEKYPGSLMGFGTWQIVGEDRVLLGAGGAYSAGSTGGEEWHTHETAFRFASYYNEVVLENHEETGVVNYDENGNKTATGNTRVDYTSAESKNNYYNASTQASKTASGQMGVYETVGHVSYAKNLPPYLAVFVWQRIA